MSTQPQEVVSPSKYSQSKYLYLDPSVTSQWQVLTYLSPSWFLPQFLFDMACRLVRVMISVNYQLTEFRIA